MIEQEIETQEIEATKTTEITKTLRLLNRKVTPEMLATDIELAYQITVNRIAEAFTAKADFLKFCESAWDYKQQAVFQEFEALLENLNDEQKEALINRIQKPKTTTRKKTVVSEE